MRLYENMNVFQLHPNLFASLLPNEFRTLVKSLQGSENRQQENKF